MPALPLACHGGGEGCGQSGTQRRFKPAGLAMETAERLVARAEVGQMLRWKTCVAGHAACTAVTGDRGRVRQ